MAYVVTENCYDCRFTDCVTACPVNCFYGDDKMLYINPDECVDCNACVPECPVQAIFAEADVPAEQQQWTQINRDKCASGELVNVTERQDPLPTAEGKKASLGL
ncbi:MAG: ferredoxin family protein [Candidatus Hydrogenedentota bacterium]